MKIKIPEFILKFKPHPNQLKILVKLIKDDIRFIVLDCGRRWGKTKLAVAIAVRLSKKDTRIWIVAPTYKLLKEDWLMLLDYIPAKMIIKKSETDMSLTFGDNSMIECRSADAGDETLRGAGLDLVIVDEASRVKESAWELGLRPSLSDKQGKAIFISTPKGRNWFYKLFLRGQDRDTHPDWLSWQFESRDNPYFPPAEWEEAKGELPADIFSQEYEANFLADEASALRNVEKCIAGDLLDMNSDDIKHDRNYIMGVDLAKHRDFTVMAVFDCQTRHLVGFERFHQQSWDKVKLRIRNMNRKYDNCLVVMDSTGVGDVIYDELSNEGMNIEPFHFTSSTKTSLIQELQVNLELMKITYPPVDVLVNELLAFAYEIKKDSGRIVYNAPDGYHDDCVIAIALAVHGMALEPSSKVSEYENRQFDQFNQEGQEQINTYVHDHTGRSKGI